MSQMADYDTITGCMFIMKEYDIPKEVADEIFSKLLDCVPEVSLEDGYAHYEGGD